MSQNSIKSEDLNRLRKELEKRLGWGEASQWHSSVFNELSEKIFEKCHVVLSPVTLKRFWGVVAHEGHPSISTLDTLAQFIDYENWRVFKLSSVPVRPKTRIFSQISRKSLYVTMGFFLAVVTFMLIANSSPENPKRFEVVSFSSRPVSNSYPNSVVFDFDLNGIDSDDLLIQQYWDEGKTISINKDQTQATAIYYFPGYFRAKMVVDGEVVKQHDLFLRSNGWLGTIEYEPVPKYFNPIVINENGMTYPEALAGEIQSSAEPLVSVYHYINDLGNVSGDNFTLKTTMKSDWGDKWAVCQTSWIYIIGSGGAMIIPFSRTGCSSDNELMLNDVYISGKEQDLSAFGTDLSEFKDVEIAVRDQQISVSIQGMEIYKGAYKSSMGRLVGVRYKFLGLGTVDSFTLLDQGGQNVELR